MTYRSIIQAALVAGLAIGASATTIAAEKPKLMMGASARMLADTCAGCHGGDGASNGPATPTIAGLSPDYFEETMEDFADGEIPSTIMGRIAKGYTKDELKTLAKYFEKLPFVPAKQEFNPKLVKKGKKLHKKYCEKCHGDGGTSAEDDAGVLAGQWTPYLSWQLANFKAGDREAPKKMKKKMKKMLSKEGSKGLEALISYYASQQK